MGQVTCEVVEDKGQKPPEVEVVLDQEAVSQRSSLEIISEIPPTPPTGTVGSSLEVNYGAANGAIYGCGGTYAETIRVTITGQMISYPSWLKVIASEQVTVSITDTSGNELAPVLKVMSAQPPFEVTWLK